MSDVKGQKFVNLNNLATVLLGVKDKIKNELQNEGVNSLSVNSSQYISVNKKDGDVTIDTTKLDSKFNSVDDKNEELSDKISRSVIDVRYDTVINDGDENTDGISLGLDYHGSVGRLLLIPKSAIKYVIGESSANNDGLMTKEQAVSLNDCVDDVKTCNTNIKALIKSVQKNQENINDVYNQLDEKAPYLFVSDMNLDEFNEVIGGLRIGSVVVVSDGVSKNIAVRFKYTTGEYKYIAINDYSENYIGLSVLVYDDPALSIPAGEWVLGGEPSNMHLVGDDVWPFDGYEQEIFPIGTYIKTQNGLVLVEANAGNINSVAGDDYINAYIDSGVVKVELNEDVKNEINDISNKITDINYEGSFNFGVDDPDSRITFVIDKNNTNYEIRIPLKDMHTFIGDATVGQKGLMTKEQVSSLNNCVNKPNYFDIRDEFVAFNPLSKLTLGDIAYLKHDLYKSSIDVYSGSGVSLYTEYLSVKEVGMSATNTFISPVFDDTNLAPGIWKLNKDEKGWYLYEANDPANKYRYGGLYQHKNYCEYIQDAGLYIKTSDGLKKISI